MKPVMRLLASSIFLLLPSAASGSEAVPTVPEQFLGMWGGGTSGCGSDEDDLALRIDREAITYYESSGPIKAIVVDGHYTIALIAELSGEGQVWLALIKFKLSAHGMRLIDETSVPGQEVIRYRCPQSNGARPNNSFKPNPHQGGA